MFSQVIANANQFLLNMLSTREILCENANFVFHQFSKRKASCRIRKSTFEVHVFSKYFMANPDTR